MLLIQEIYIGAIIQYNFPPIKLGQKLRILIVIEDTVVWVLSYIVSYKHQLDCILVKPSNRYTLGLKHRHTDTHIAASKNLPL